MNHYVRKVTARAALVIGSLALVTAGCGGSTVHRTSRAASAGGKPVHGVGVHALTPATTETQIAALQQRVGLAVASVHCPQHVQIRVGHSFTCVSRLARGGSITTTVTPTNVALGNARFHFLLPE